MLPRELCVFVCLFVCLLFFFLFSKAVWCFFVVRFVLKK